ncbi:MAG: tetratricopeptide repeat protein [Ferruginibacter sp.]
MKYLLLISIIFLAACNDNDNIAKKNDQVLSREQQLKKDIAQYPDSALLTESLVQYYREGNNYGQALIVVNHAIKKDSNNPRLWDINATLNIENNDTAAAIHSFEKAISFYPDPQYIISLGILYAQTKNAAALQMADALLVESKAKADKEAFFIKGLYYSYTGNKQKAIGFFDECLSISYTYMDAYIEKALALYDLKKYAEALAVLDKAVTLQNNFDEGYYYRGRCLEKLNRPQEAAEAYHMALLYDHDYLEAKEALAKLGVN